MFREGGAVVRSSPISTKTKRVHPSFPHCNLTRFDRNPTIADLDVEHNELAQTWKSFIRHLSPDNRVDWDHRPQTVDDVNALVRSLQSFWKARPRQRVYSQARVLSDQFLPTLNTHATLLARLPDANLHYAPNFYGALQSVLKVGFLVRSRACVQSSFANPTHPLGIVALSSSDGGTAHRSPEYPQRPGRPRGPRHPFYDRTHRENLYSDILLFDRVYGLVCAEIYLPIVEEPQPRCLLGVLPFGQLHPAPSESALRVT